MSQENIITTHRMGFAAFCMLDSATELISKEKGIYTLRVCGSREEKSVTYTNSREAKFNALLIELRNT